MATGRRPFTGPTTGVVDRRVLNRAPGAAARRSIPRPAAAAAIIDKLLEKDRDLRYQRASDVRADLKRAQRDASGGHRAARRREAGPRRMTSVAVLPFRNMSRDPDSAVLQRRDHRGSDRRARRASTASASRRARRRSASAIPAGAAGSRRRARRRRARRGQRAPRRQPPAGQRRARRCDRPGSRPGPSSYDREMADVFDIQDEIVSSLVPRSRRRCSAVPSMPCGGRPTTSSLRALPERAPLLASALAEHAEASRSSRSSRRSRSTPIYALAYAGLADSWALYRLTDGCRSRRAGRRRRSRSSARWR